MSKVQGHNLVVLFKDGSWKAAAYATTCELDVTTTCIQSGSQNAGKWAHMKPKGMSWRVTAGHLLSDVVQPVDFSALQNAGTRLQIAFTTVNEHEALTDPPTFTPDSAFNKSGFCYITRYTATGRNGDFATCSIELTGDGELYNDLHELSDYANDFNDDFNNQPAENE